MSCTENRQAAFSDAQLEKLFYYAIGMIYDAEMEIDDNKTLYLITWCPDPKELPDACFETQHEFNVDILSDYCKACDVAIFCVETTQMGVPHYHGFYQPSTDNFKESARIAIIKTLERFGRLKITKSKGMYKKMNFWTPHANCLYYYKKDLLDAMLGQANNPIDKHSKSLIDFSSTAQMFVKAGKRQTSKEIIEQQTLRERYRNFYSNKDFYGVNERTI